MFAALRGILFLFGLIPAAFQKLRDVFLRHSVRQEMRKEAKLDAGKRQNEAERAMIKIDAATEHSINEARKTSLADRLDRLRSRTRRTSL